MKNVSIKFLKPCRYSKNGIKIDHALAGDVVIVNERIAVALAKDGSAEVLDESKKTSEKMSEEHANKSLGDSPVNKSRASARTSKASKKKKRR